MRDDNSSSGAPQRPTSLLPTAPRRAERGSTRPRVSGNRRLGELIELLWGTVFTVERCLDELAGSGSGMETYQHLLERVASLRIGYFELSELEQGALRHNMAMLEDELEDLTKLLSRKIAMRRQAPPVRPSARPAISSFAPAQ